MASRIKLLVACREFESASALARRLGWSDERIAAEATVLPRVLERVAATQPDVLMLEYALELQPVVFAALTTVRDEHRDTRVLLVAEAPPQQALTAFVHYGASGCVLASTDPALQAKAVLAVQRGETWFARSELLAALRRQLPDPPAAAPIGEAGDAVLTAREREILSLIGSAMTNKEIARRLNISDQTVKTHLHHIYVKLQRSGRYKALLSNAPAAPLSAPPPERLDNT